MNQDYIKPNNWSIIEEGFDKNSVKSSESLFSIGNGAMGQRANFEEKYSGDSLQGSYVGGVYYPDKTRVGWWKNGYPEYFAKVLNSCNWIGINIEIDGEQAVDWLETNYLGNPARANDEVLETLKALSTQGAPRFSELRPRIAESYQLLIETHPQLAGWVARDLVTWQDWSFAEPLAELRSSETILDGPSIFAIDYYLGRARHRRKLP